MSRLKILSENDFAKLYGLPELNHEEKNYLFVLDEYDNEYLSKIDHLVIKVNYVLQLGYFKVGHHFYNFKQKEVEEDINFIVEICCNGRIKRGQQISKRQYYNNKNAVLKKYQMTDYDANMDGELENT